MHFINKTNYHYHYTNNNKNKPFFYHFAKFFLFNYLPKMAEKVPYIIDDLNFDTLDFGFQ